MKWNDKHNQNTITASFLSTFPINNVLKKLDENWT